MIWSGFHERNFFLLTGKQGLYAELPFWTERYIIYCLFVYLLTNFTKIIGEAVLFWLVFASGTSQSLNSFCNVCLRVVIQMMMMIMNNNDCNME